MQFNKRRRCTRRSRAGQALGLLAAAVAVATVAAMLNAASASSAGSVSRGPSSDGSQQHSSATDGFLPAPAAGDGKRNSLTVWTLSTRPEYVTGGDVLIRIDVPASMPVDSVRVAVNRRDVTESLSRNGRNLVGSIEGLRGGKNILEVVGDAKHQEHQRLKVELVNHSTIGPLFSGPKQTPFVCRTSDNDLGEPLDENCSIDTRYDWFYRSLDGRFVPLDPAAPLPDDVAKTTTMAGENVDYVVRVETGTINRAIYRIAILADPQKPEAVDSSGWNNKLQYRFGGGCGPGYQQGNSRVQEVLDDPALSRGFATATSSLNVLGTACDDVLSAETALMVKEHFIEEYGYPEYTVGQGGSGGSMQQLLIAQNYPGILDGITPARLYPDATTTWHTETDCRLLRPYFEKTTLGWTDSQRLAVEGFGSLTCGTWDRPDGNIDQTVGCSIPSSLIFDPVTNPTGARCSLYDSMGNLFGRDKSGAALRPLDNVGIQYGLEAFNAGAISFEQFVDLNRRIGGYDEIGKPTSKRTRGNLTGIRTAYASGRIFSGTGVHLPIIDVRFWGDGTQDIHDSFRSASLRQRLERANGHSKNQVTLVAGARRGSQVLADLDEQLLDTMDEWLESILRDRSKRSYDNKVLKAKPRGLISGCYTDPGGEFIADPRVTISAHGPCGEIYPPHGNPRTASGSSTSEDVAKCQLKPVDRRDYSSITPAQLNEIRDVFDNRACDYRKRGVNQVPLEGTWLTY